MEPREQPKFKPKDVVERVITAGITLVQKDEYV